MSQATTTDKPRPAKPVKIEVKQAPRPASNDFPTCANCRYRGRYDFRCHRHPPQMAQVGFGEWPPVKDDGWCGEHQRREA